ncbi:MAG: glycosyltransferase family A protein [Gammaproteobacteria bacterium]|nr:glycosyltransferase family A protein [Gammaproteobacteria bacterium]MDX2488035.1 glycosyltransferase family A protein [Gammaproteobacteria bacterium]
MVTQQGRLTETKQAINCFIRQNISPIELIVLHDSGDLYHTELQLLIEDYKDANIHIYQESAAHTLGWLRNRSVELSSAELICQWDDDDFSHPERLKAQYEMLQAEGTDFCFMTDQLHLFTKQRFLFWDDWSSRQPPFDLIESTVLAKKNLLGKYLDLTRGEDTAIIEHISANQHKVSRLSGMGWLYIYVFNGKNTWGFDHHSAISMRYHLKAAELLDHEDLLMSELKQYELPCTHLYMPHDKGKIEFNF